MTWRIGTIRGQWAVSSLPQSPLYVVKRLVSDGGSTNAFRLWVKRLPRPFGIALRAKFQSGQDKQTARMQLKTGPVGYQHPLARMMCGRKGTLLACQDAPTLDVSEPRPEPVNRLSSFKRRKRNQDVLCPPLRTAVTSRTNRTAPAEPRATAAGLAASLK